jgi:hypothetical protein
VVLGEEAAPVFRLDRNGGLLQERMGRQVYCCQLG